MFLRLVLFVLVSGLTISSTLAEVVRFEIQKREPFAKGKNFGKVGPYERIIGRVYYTIDPKLRQNQTIIDLKHAPRDKAGKVLFHSDLFILSPKDSTKGNGAILYDVNNRGKKLAMRFFNFASDNNDPKSAKDAGDGFLLRKGFTVVWSGWDGELLPGNNSLRLFAPVAKNDGKPITGPIRCEMVPTDDSKRIPVTRPGHGSYYPTEHGIKTATLTYRIRANDKRIPIPRDQWKLHVTKIDSDSPSQLPKVEIELPAGFKNGHLYEVIYEARDPLVHGTCFAGLRDLISAFKHGTGKDNPLTTKGKPTIKRAHGFGVSQSGRFLREFVYWGFNEDEQGRQVFDGVIPHVSGSGLGSFNHRFAQPTRHVTQHDHHDYPADRFPFTYATQYDPLSKQTDGILKRATATKTAPFILHTQSAAEYWTRSGSLAQTDPLGKRDAKIPANVRYYLFGGTQHGPGGYPPRKGAGKYLNNPGDYRPFLRALLLALDKWSKDGTPPPPSVMPSIAKKTLVDWKQSSTGFPNIPGIVYPKVIQCPPLLDFGPRWQSERIMDIQPPKQLAHYRVLVPRCNEDGNEIDCLSPPEVQVPVATYTGWNLRNKAVGAENELVSLTGSYIPFPVTEKEKAQTGDPRDSLEKRYGNLEKYLKQLKSACLALKAKGYLLDEDVARTMNIHKQRVAPLFEKVR